MPMISPVFFPAGRSVCSSWAMRLPTVVCTEDIPFFLSFIMSPSFFSFLPAYFAGDTIIQQKIKKGLQFRYDIPPTANIPQEGVDLLIAEHKKHPSNPYILLSRHFGFWVTVWVRLYGGSKITTL